MDQKAVFNMTICILGISVFLIHSIDLWLKKGKRNDEKNLLVFFVFTALHFATYLTFVLIKTVYTSDAFIMGFYTTFYIMNNVELIFLFVYAVSYVGPKKKTLKITTIINLVLFVSFVLLDLANLFGHFFFYAENGAYVRAPLMLLSQGYQFVAFVIVFFLAVMSKNLGRTEKVAFVLYCLLPLIAIVLQNLLPGYAIAYLSIIVSIEILFLFANMRKNAALANEERKTKEAEIRLMISQIQPHFIYNTLSSISTLITIDPDQAQTAIDDFAEYLRTNLSFLSDVRGIPFTDELRHTQTYLSLEKMRFAERLTVVLDIQDNEFTVPPLSIQPLVENAVKHGILQKIEGGTVTIKTYKTETAHVVEIHDDGVGFDVDNVQKGGVHIGLQNVSQRIASMNEGKLEIHSKPGEGTTAIVTFRKEG